MVGASPAPRADLAYQMGPWVSKALLSSLRLRQTLCTFIEYPQLSLHKIPEACSYSCHHSWGARLAICRKLVSGAWRVSPAVLACGPHMPHSSLLLSLWAQYPGLAHTTQNPDIIFLFSRWEIQSSGKVSGLPKVTERAINQTMFFLLYLISQIKSTSTLTSWMASFPQTPKLLFYKREFYSL